jgi:hypothetical protein
MARLSAAAGALTTQDGLFDFAQDADGEAIECGFFG